MAKNSGYFCPGGKVIAVCRLAGFPRAIDPLGLVLKHIRRLWTILAAAAVFTAAALPVARAQGSSSTVPTVQIEVPRVVTTTPKYDWPTITVDAAEVAVGLAALFGLPAIAYQVNAARRNTISEHTATLQTQWESRDFLGELGPVIAFLDVSSIDDCMKKVRAWAHSKHVAHECLPRTPSVPGAPLASPADVLHVLLFYEDICQRYNNGEVNDLMVASGIGPELVARFVAASWYIHWQRAVLSDDFLYGEWQKTLVDLRRERPHWWSGGRRHWWSGVHPVYASLREKKVEFSPRVVCTPPTPKSAFPADWKRAARLAKALTLSTAFPDSLMPRDSRPAEQLKSSAKRGWIVALLPPSLDCSPTRRAWHRAFAVEIERRLDKMEPAAIKRATEALERGECVTDSFNFSLMAVRA